MDIYRTYQTHIGHGNEMKKAMKYIIGTKGDTKTPKKQRTKEWIEKLITRKAKPNLPATK